MAASFSGGAIGALAGGLAWTSGGWPGVCLLGGAMTLTAAIMLAANTLATLRVAPQQSDAE
jgi:hypothetical protein